MMGRLIGWSVLLAGCQDYNFSKQDDALPGDDTAVDTAPPPVDTGALPECGGDFEGFEAAQDEECLNEVQTGSFTPTEEWAVESFSTAPTYNNVMMQPIVASLTDDDGDGDIDEDDTPDILVTSYAGSAWTSAGVLRALSGDGGRELWANTTHSIQGSGLLAAGDIDGDGIVEIVAANTSNQIVAFEHDGTVKWTSPTLSISTYCYATAPAISDMDSDGSPEIVAANVILNHDGTVRTTISGLSGQCVSFPADIDGDGTEELVAGGAVYRLDGGTVWARDYDGYPAVADFDADGQAEVVLSDTSGTIRLFDTDGTPLWSYGSALSGPPTIADFDGDGEPEIGVAGRSTYTVIEGDGTPLWQNATTDASSGRTGSAVFDFEGDGVAEVVYADEYTLWVYSGADGAVKLEETNHTSWTWIEYPVIADVDGDDQAEIILPNGSIGGSASGARYGIAVIGDLDQSWRPARKIWNQHAYSITNVNDDGTIPATADLNWLTYNNFRSGDLRPALGTTSADARVTLGELCELECDRDRLHVWVHPGNEGLAALTAGTASIAVSADVGGTLEPLDATTLSSAVPAGRYRSAVQFTFEGEDFSSWDALIFDIEVDELECDSTNNRLRLAGPFCD